MSGSHNGLRCALRRRLSLRRRALLAEGGLAFACWPKPKGVDNAFRQALRDMGLPYAVGVTSTVVFWSLGVQPLPPKRYSDVGHPPAAARRIAPLQAHQPPGVAMSLQQKAFLTIAWHEGSNGVPRERFTVLRMRHVAPCAGCRGRHACVSSSGGSSSGRQTTRSRASTPCPRYQQRRPRTNSSSSSISAGAPSATARI